MKAALPALLALAATSVVQAEPGLRADARLEFRIRIPSVLQLRLHDHPRDLVISVEDSERGYVTIRGPRIELSANHRAGGELIAEFPGTLVQGLEIAGLQAPARFDSSGSRVAIPRTAGTGNVYGVEYRLKLAPAVAAGTYAWPIGLSLGQP